MNNTDKFHLCILDLKPLNIVFEHMIHLEQHLLKDLMLESQLLLVRVQKKLQKLIQCKPSNLIFFKI
jgi:hypothetical protein